MGSGGTRLFDRYSLRSTGTVIVAGCSTDVAPKIEQEGRYLICLHLYDDVFVYTFEYVEPGSYRVSIDRKTWIPVVVTSSPAQQAIEISVPP